MEISRKSGSITDGDEASDTLHDAVAANAEKNRFWLASGVCD
jgi:hypothetical protein